MGSEEGVCRALVCESVYKYMRERMCAFMSVCRRVCLCESVDILGTAGLASPEWPRCSGLCTVCVLALNPESCQRAAQRQVYPEWLSELRGRTCTFI